MITAFLSLDHGFLPLDLLYNCSNNQIYQNGKPACNKLTWQMMMTKPQLGQVVNIYGFISSSSILTTNKIAGFLTNMCLQYPADGDKLLGHVRHKGY